ncbi:MAG TPA: SufE family protein [Phycisphaeraceae bacterium]
MSMTGHPEADQLVQLFEFLDDWEDRYRLIIDLGKELTPLDPADLVEANRVHGCQSTVYLVHRVDESAQPPRIDFLAQSDAAIVNGLIAILRRVYSGRTPQEVLGFDIESLLRQLGLNEHLSPTRRNGLYEMVKRIRGIAQRYLNRQPAAS